MKQPSLGVDFSNDYVAELHGAGEVRRGGHGARDAPETPSSPTRSTSPTTCYCLDLESGRILWQKQLPQRPAPGGSAPQEQLHVRDAGDRRQGDLRLRGLSRTLRLRLRRASELWHTPAGAPQVYLDFGRRRLAGAPRRSSLHPQRQRGGELHRRVRHPHREGSCGARARPGLGSDAAALGLVDTVRLGERRSAPRWSPRDPAGSISYDLDGQELWRMSGMAAMTIQSPFSWDGLLYLTSGAREGTDQAASPPFVPVPPATSPCPRGAPPASTSPGTTRRPAAPTCRPRSSTTADCTRSPTRGSSPG